MDDGSRMSNAIRRGFGWTVAERITVSAADADPRAEAIDAS
jgi:hypothetical protein